MPRGQNRGKQSKSKKSVVLGEGEVGKLSSASIALAQGFYQDPFFPKHLQGYKKLGLEIKKRKCPLIHITICVILGNLHGWEY